MVIKDNNVVYFLVNGSSKESKIQFYDEYITLYEIGKQEVSFHSDTKQIKESPPFVLELYTAFCTSFYSI